MACPINAFSLHCEVKKAKVSARAYLSRQLAESQTAAVVPPDQLEQFIRTQLLASKLGENDPAAANEAITRWPSGGSTGNRKRSA